MSKQSDDTGLFVILGLLVGLVIVLCTLLYKMIKESVQWLRRHNSKAHAKPAAADLWRMPPPQAPTLRAARQPAPSRRNDPWLDHCIEIENAWNRGNYDWARMQLQKIAYGMVGNAVTDAQRADFTRLMTAFAKEDPLYRDVMARVLPLVQANPGMLQSQIYKGQPDGIKEQMRYVLYFANELGHIKRIKKGNSYKLMLPDEVNDSGVEYIGQNSN